MEKFKKILGFIALVILGVMAFSVYQLWLNQNRAERHAAQTEKQLEQIQKGGDVIAAAKAQIKNVKLPLSLGPDLRLDAIALEDHDQSLVFTGTALTLHADTLTAEQKQALLAASTSGVCADPFSQAFLSAPNRKIVKIFRDADGKDISTLAIDNAWCRSNPPPKN